ncbi:pyridoxal-phosphate-dependent aminotransferase family protein [Geomesophilobacter sediminis]|uniref:Alanine--glyoxylate aminotransferase family protein n=1 Tax=Geomesophilobacter sediminis TaxID=2798584 RepID=A0A8J7S8U1_9BACT|nr:alanine--glyoxylate aminotransferase family protein [Geomesophilobacter sediminis]MBJ6727856.1 alanine--glyoxylate aminotransferase family protein [Geomesophilobacter sediminis]
MHKKLFIPGPVEVAPEILKAMGTPMIGHRMPEYAKLHKGVTDKLKQLLATQDRVFLSTSSAFGAMEGAVRNLVAKRCANFCNGAFSDKWHNVTVSCGKEADAIKVPWGEAITPELVDATLATGKYDAITLIHNETSTGVMSPLPEIAQVLKKYPDVVSIIDTVSSMSALNIPVGELGIDCCVFGVQKAFALPPGLAVFTATPKALERAKGVPGRGYYFDFLEFAAADEKDNTPSTPCISLIYAMDLQLDRMFTEGLENRWRRHQEMAQFVRAWATERGFGLFPAEGYRSVTLTCATNDAGVDLAQLKKALGEKGYAFDDGYGKLKGKTFRVAHMGDMTLEDVKEITGAIETVLKQQ